MEKTNFEEEIKVLEKEIKEKIRYLKENPEETNYTWVWNLVDACNTLKQWNEERSEAYTHCYPPGFDIR